MKIRHALLLSLFVPATALAQAPSGDPSQPPPPPPPGYAQPGPPPGYAPGPPPGYAPGYPPGYVPRSWLRRGFTFEGNLGFGYVHASDSTGDTSNSDITLAGLDIGVGGFLTPNLALTVRIAGVTFSTDNGNERLVDEFVGPSLQYWVNDNVWLRGGIGWAVLSALSTNDGTSYASESAFGVDLGVGYSFSSRTRHTLNISAEATPGFFSEGTATTVSFLIGYQYL